MYSFFKRGSDAYSSRVKRVLNRKRAALVVYAGLIALTVFGFLHVPAGYIPAQDKQYLIGFAQLPDGSSLDRTEDVIRRMSEISMKTPGVAHAPRRVSGRQPAPRCHVQASHRP